MIGHVEGGDCRCLRCEAFGKRPDEAANILETRRRERAKKAADRERLAAIKENHERRGHHA